MRHHPFVVDKEYRQTESHGPLTWMNITGSQN